MNKSSHAMLTTRQALGTAMATLIGFSVLCLIVLLRGRDGPMPTDSSWNATMTQMQSATLTSIAKAFNIVGGLIVSGIVIPLIVSLVLLLRREYWSTLFVIAVTIADAVVVKAVKMAIGRPRPVDMMVTADPGSFPSGHSANAAVLALMLALLFVRRRWLRYLGAVYVLAMMASRTYLHVHWLSDTIAGLLIGVSTTLLVWVGFRRRLISEEQDLETTAIAARTASLPAAGPQPNDPTITETGDDHWGRPHPHNHQGQS